MHQNICSKSNENLHALRIERTDNRRAGAAAHIFGADKCQSFSFELVSEDSKFDHEKFKYIGVDDKNITRLACSIFEIYHYESVGLIDLLNTQRAFIAQIISGSHAVSRYSRSGYDHD